ncbi:MAG: SRPBCC domain-containing protein [Pseudomonadota bacterium]
MTPITLTKTIILAAPPAHVWKFLTEKERLATWFHAGATDFAAGGAYAVLSNTYGREGEKVVWGEILTFDPPNRLVHTFTHNGLGDVKTTCTWTLAPIDGGTLLTLVHSGFEQLADGARAAGGDHDKGWDEHFVRLRAVAA